jgi:hypothetical protein
LRASKAEMDGRREAPTSCPKSAFRAAWWERPKGVRRRPARSKEAEVSEPPRQQNLRANGHPASSGCRNHCPCGHAHPLVDRIPQIRKASEGARLGSATKAAFASGRREGFENPAPQYETEYTPENLIQEASRTVSNKGFPAFPDMRPRDMMRVPHPFRVLCEKGR